MPAKIRDIEDALMFTADQSFGNEAYISKSKGAVYIVSDIMDEADMELPDDLYDSDDYVLLPDERDLGLGSPLVFRFVEEYLPEHYDKVRSFFHSRGAYSRFKKLLEDTDKLQSWYDYEAEATQQAIREWCEVEGVELEDTAITKS